MILGIDLGNVNVKTSTRTIFQNRHITNEKLYEDEDNLRVEFENEKYVIGSGEYQTNYQKSKKTDLLLNLYTSISLSTTDNINQIVVGLPVQQYKNGRESFEAFINGNKIKDITVNGMQRRILISDCKCFPEGLAVYYCLNQEIKIEIGNRDIIIIDIGGRITDICLYSLINGKRKLLNYVTIPAGTLNIYSDFIQEINDKFELDKLKEEASDVLRNGLWVDGEKVQIQYTKPIFERYTERILSELRLNYPIRTSKVILCGGGSQLLKGLLQKEIKGITVIDDIFCNAIGFKRVGDQIWNSNR